MKKISRFPPWMNEGSWVVILSIGLHLAIVLPLAAVLNIWIDEAHTMNTISGSLAHTMERAIEFEMQPPLYFVALKLWSTWGSSIYFLRLFSVLCMVLSIWLASRISGKMFSAPSPGFLALAVALNPYAIWAATEMRLYAFLVFLSTALVWMFIGGFLEDDIAAKKKRFWFFVLAVLSLYTQYYAAFLLAAFVIALAVLKRWSGLKKLIGWYVLTAFCAIPLFMSAVRQMTQHRRFMVVDNDPLNYLSVAFRFLRYPFRLEWMPSTVYMLLYTAGAIGLLMLVAKYRRGLASGHWLTLILNLVITVFFLAALLIVNSELVDTTHTTVLFISSLLLPVAFLNLLPNGQKRRSALLLLLGMTIANTGYLVREYRPMAKFGDSRRVAEYISGNEKPGQPILVFIAELALPLARYYSGVNTIIPIPEKISDMSYDLNAFALKNSQEIWGALERENLRPEYLWVFNWGLCKYLGVDYHCEILEAFIQEGFTVEDDKEFFRSRVRLLRRRDR